MLEPSLDRRSFARWFAAGAAMALPGAAQAATDETSPSDERPETPADLILKLIEHRYPHEFTDEERAELRHEIESQQARSRLLSEFPLVNSDEPAGGFSAWRADSARKD